MQEHQQQLLLVSAGWPRRSYISCELITDVGLQAVKAAFVHLERQIIWVLSRPGFLRLCLPSARVSSFAKRSKPKKKPCTHRQS